MRRCRGLFLQVSEHFCFDSRTKIYFFQLISEEFVESLVSTLEDRGWCSRSLVLECSYHQPHSYQARSQCTLQCQQYLLGGTKSINWQFSSLQSQFSSDGRLLD